MNILLDIDWRFEPTRLILEALSAGLDSIACELDAAPDALGMIEIGDNMVGIAFVAAQVYINGVIADLAATEKAVPLPNKWQLIRERSRIVADTRITQIELCDTVANYYKHRDEWGDWSAPPMNAGHTIEKLQRAGFGRNDPSLCYDAAALLLGTADVQSLVPICDALSLWRRHTIAALR